MRKLIRSWGGWAVMFLLWHSGFIVIHNSTVEKCTSPRWWSTEHVTGPALCRAGGDDERREMIQSVIDLKWVLLMLSGNWLQKWFTQPSAALSVVWSIFTNELNRVATWIIPAARQNCHLIDSDKRLLVCLCRLLCTPEMKVDRGVGQGQSLVPPHSEQSLTWVEIQLRVSISVPEISVCCIVNEREMALSHRYIQCLVISATQAAPAPPYELWYRQWVSHCFFQKICRFKKDMIWFCFLVLGRSFVKKKKQQKKIKINSISGAITMSDNVGRAGSWLHCVF